MTTEPPDPEFAPGDDTDLHQRVDALLDDLLALDAAGRAARRLQWNGQLPSDTLELLDGRLAELEAIGLLDEPAGGGAALPERLGAFELGERLGEGGMGVVYRARQSGLERDVALKVMRPEHALFRGARARFHREARVIARLEHAHIVPIHEFGHDGGIDFLVMPLLTGQALSKVAAAVGTNSLRDGGGDSLDLEAAVADVSRDGRPDGESRTARPPALHWQRAVARCGVQLAAALQHAHERGVLHRDVKPSNVFLATDGTPLLLDFGLARVPNEADDAQLTRTGAVLGSTPYMAPEQLRGEPVDARSDLFGLGCVLFELLTGSAAFAGDQPTAVLQRIESSHPERDLQRLGVATELAWILARCLRPTPGDRYADAASLGDDLRAWLEHRPVQARPPSTWRRLQQYASREPWRVAALGAALLAALTLAGAGGYLFAQRDRLVAGDAALRLAQRDDDLLAAWAAVVEDRRDLAKRRFDALLAREPNLAEARVGLEILNAEPADTTLPEDRGDPASAFHRATRALFTDHRGDTERAEQALRDARLAVLRSRRSQPIFVAMVAQCAASLGAADIAEQAAGTLRANWPDSAWCAYWAGYALLEVRPPAAAAALRRATDLDPEFAEAHATLGLALWSTGDPAAAETSLRAALSIEPTAARTLLDLGTMLDEIGRTEEALPLLQRATEHAPQLPGAHYALGLARAATDPAASRTDFETATKLDPWFAAAWSNLGTLRQRDGDLDGAATAYREGVTRRPDHVGCWTGLRHVAATRGDLTTTLEASRELVRLLPDSADEHAYLCQILEHAGDSTALTAERARFAAATAAGSAEFDR